MSALTFKKNAARVKFKVTNVVEFLDVLLAKAVVNTHKSLKDDKFRQIGNELRHLDLIPSLKNRVTQIDAHSCRANLGERL